MKARPILMSAPMVRALLDGSKTQTRRIVKDIPWHEGVNQRFSQLRALHAAGLWQFHGSEDASRPFRCPYGQPGDLLWVRETTAFWWSKGKPTRVAGYRADVDDPDWDGFGHDDPWWLSFDWTPSIHMPRWASRLTLELTGVRVERLQDISEKDGRAEGMEPFGFGWRAWEGQPHVLHARHAYQDCWNSINGFGSWNENPWVWVLTFKVHRCNVDQLIAARVA